MTDGFVLLQRYQPHDPQKPLSPYDSKELVIGCITYGAKPLFAETNGKKVLVSFYTEDVEEIVNKINCYLAGVTTEPLTFDYGVHMKAEKLWQHLMSMLRPYHK